MRRLTVVLVLVLSVPQAAIAIQPVLTSGGSGDAPPYPRDENACWSQPPYLEGSAFTSEIIAEFGLVSEVANDFLFDESVVITGARWWGLYNGFIPDDPLVTSVNLLFYDDDGGAPGNLLAEIIVPNDCNETFLGEFPYGIFEYHTDIEFSADAGVIYWFVVQCGDHDFPPQWMLLEALQEVGYSSMLRSPYFAYPDWTSIEELHGGPWDSALEFRCGSIVIEHDHLDPTEDQGVPYVVEAEISSLAGELDPEAIWLKYKSDRPGLWIPVRMENAGQTLWQATIPGQDQPAEVSYYILARDLAGNEGNSPYEGAANPYRYEVAWEAETFELTDGAFIVNPDGDDNTMAGHWNHGVPGEEALEPREDHTTVGSHCWFTGDGVLDGSIDWSVKTTLQSPAYSLAGARSAKLKYWRWLAAPGWTSRWRVHVRNDGGGWLEVEDTQSIETDWRQVEIDLFAQYGEGLGDVEVRFIASDSLDWDGGLEAAVDDFVVLVEFDTPDHVVDGSGTPGLALHRPHPNPFLRAAEIRYEIPEMREVSLAVHDAAGRLVRSLLEDRPTPAGLNVIVWDGRTDTGRQAHSGVYYLRLRSDGLWATRPIVLLR